MAGWFYITSDIDPYPKIHIPHTYPEKGQHLHSLHHLSSIPYVAHNLYSKFHDKDMDAHQPRTDVRETMKNFYLEVELPGVKDHEELRLRWTNSRTLLLSSRIPRPEIPEEELLEEPVVPVTPSVATIETGPPNGEATVTTTTPAGEEHESTPNAPPTTPPKPKLLPPHLTIHERLIGEMLRGFTFPVDVDRDTTHAKLDAGVLRIVVPKVVHEAPIAGAEGEEKHFLHIPVRVFSHGHEKAEKEEKKEKEEKPDDPVPAHRRSYIESLGDRLF
ncbi:hypothetical protein H2200_007892 [Cladophialophora chaetospira]|uniref:SHSP domain-containing protein n=1 Tax=Cladophialophora chaetospira TaxID=386627 RepID=A0AA39CH10_9EURO|nr:hypothetical protein H2200_007892 [Cladophialophora chaetospira]